jgi:hypothetical protein
MKVTRSYTDNASEWPELRAYIENGREVGEPTSSALSVTDEEYHEFWAGGPTKESVHNAMGAAFCTYAYERPGKLYWRITPEIENDGGRWRSYMRLLVSDKPKVTHG